MKTISELMEKGAKALVTTINSRANTIQNSILEIGIMMFVVGKGKSEDVTLKKHLAEAGVDCAKAPQNSFQVARAAFLIGEDEKSQPTMKDAPTVAEGVFVAAPTRVLMAVSTALNTLDTCVKEEKMTAAEAEGHKAALCACIVRKDAKGAKAIADTLKKLAGNGGEEEEELPEALESAADILLAVALAGEKVPKVKWAPEEIGKLRLLLNRMCDQIDAVEKAAAPTTVAA